MRILGPNLTDAEKIEHLWGRLDKMNQELESTKVLLQKAEDIATRKQQLIEQRDKTIQHLSDEIRRLGVEINSARMAAANAVQNHIKLIGG